jgi:hypothetical protein
MYDWPIDDIRAALDRPAGAPAVSVGGPAGEVRDALLAAGFGPALAGMMGAFYDAADGGTFCDGALRVIPFRGDPENGMPGLLEWNSAGGWRDDAPPAAKRIFVFLTNAFGDPMGVVTDDGGELGRNTAAILWVEKYEVEESKFGWDKVFRMFLAGEHSMDRFLARLTEFEWVEPALGTPTPDQCFSWKLLPAMGGPETLDNIQIVSTYVHVAFTLQVFKQYLEQKRP